MQNKYVPKIRLPMGFSGEWGKCYKRFTVTEDIQLNEDIVEFENNYYREIGADIQFKRTAEIVVVEEQVIKGLIVKTFSTTLITTDAYFDSDFNEYRCCVSEGDIVKYNNRLWMVSSMQVKTKRNPNNKNFYYLDIRSI